MTRVLEPEQTVARPHVFDVTAYYRMGETGILPTTLRTELIHGEILEMPPIGPFHADRTDRVAELLYTRKPADVRVRIQNPVRLDAYNEPQPDLALVRRCNYGSTHPAATDVLLIIEISDSSLSYDRKVKVPLYAQAGIPEVWLVDIRGKVMEVYRDPYQGSYQTVFKPGEDEQVISQCVPGLVVTVAELFAI